MFKQPLYKKEIKAETDGYIKNIDAYKTAFACKLLGAGREKKDDEIDYSAGVVLNKIYSEKVYKDEVIATLYSDSQEKINQAVPILKSGVEITTQKPEKRIIVYKAI